MIETRNFSGLKEARRRAGLSQHEVAVEIQVSQQAIDQWERGKTVPRTEYLPRLSRLYDTPVDALLGLDGNRYERLEARVRELERKLERLAK